MPLFFNTLALLFALITAGAYWYGVEESLFWMYPWYDIMLHLMGGLVMGFWAGAVSARLGLAALPAFLLIASVVIVGAGVWEVFEYAIGVDPEGNYALDTTADLLNGCIGGFVAALIFLVFRKASHVS